VNEDLLQSWPEEFIPDDLLENAVLTEPGLSDNREGYAMDREEMTQGDSDEVFETDLDCLSLETLIRGLLLLGLFYKTLKVAIVGGRGMPPYLRSWRLPTMKPPMRRICPFHISSIRVLLA